MMRFLLLSLAILTTTSAYSTGSVHSTVIPLDKAGLEAALKDPANPKWLLKFYAPWCGHCKRLAPVLEKVAAQVTGKMAVGTIDCTMHKPACDAYSVRGYPTLKFTIDGTVYDYPGGRQEQEFVSFAEKLNRPAVQKVASLQDAFEYAKNEAEEGVAFVAHHSEVQGGEVEEQTQSTQLTQVYAQAARKLQAEGHFLLLDPKADTGDLVSPFVCRLEENVETRCAELEDLDTPKMLEFMRAANVATVSSLGPHNFNKIGRKGRPLVIGVLDMTVSEQLQEAKMALSTFATSADRRDDYYYGYFDGKQWQKFLEQFDVQPDQLPQVFVLNVPTKDYWQNATYGLNVHDFLEAVNEGTIPPKKAGKKGLEGLLQRFGIWMDTYRPWSVVFLVMFFVVAAITIAACVTPGDDFRPPYPREEVEATNNNETTAKKTKDSDEPAQDDSKKDN